MNTQDYLHMIYFKIVPNSPPTKKGSINNCLTSHDDFYLEEYFLHKAVIYVYYFLILIFL